MANFPLVPFFLPKGRQLPTRRTFLPEKTGTSKWNVLCVIRLLDKPGNRGDRFGTEDEDNDKIKDRAPIC